MHGLQAQQEIKEPQLLSFLLKIKKRFKAIPAHWLKFIPVLLILLALPITVAVVQIQTNKNTRAADTITNPPKPNIILVVLDDIPYVGDAFFSAERFPNINSIFIENGISFQNADGNDPLCCPGRANILTGQYSHINGVVRNDARLLNANETIATELKDSGYYTFITGKYLNFTEKLSNKKPPGWDNVAIMSGGYFNYSGFINGIEIRKGIKDADYSTDFFAGIALQFLDSAPQDKPLFGYIAPYAVHYGKDQQGVQNGYYQPAPAPRHKNDPRCDKFPRYKPANFNEANVSDKPAYIRTLSLLGSGYSNGFPVKNHCEALLSVDEEIGTIMAKLKEQGRYDNTLWIMIGDNGMGWGSHRWIRKRAPYATQIPLYMSWPILNQTPTPSPTPSESPTPIPTLEPTPIATISATPIPTEILTPTSTQTSSSTLSPLTLGATSRPLVITERVENIDLAPTICELAGCTMGPYPNGHSVNGQSLAGLIAPQFSSSVPNRTAILMEHVDSPRIPKWKSIKTTSQNSLGLWHYIRYATGEKELYDISGGPCLLWRIGMPGDPCELTNLARKAKYATILNKLNKQLDSMWGLSANELDPSETVPSAQQLLEIQQDEDEDE